VRQTLQRPTATDPNDSCPHSSLALRHCAALSGFPALKASTRALVSGRRFSMPP